MEYIEKENLCLYQIEEEKRSLSFEEIGPLVGACLSTLIYIEKDGLLYGRIGPDEFKQTKWQGAKEVFINRHPKTFLPEQVYLARKDLRETGFFSVPVVDESGRLVGEWRREDSRYIPDHLLIQPGSEVAKAFAKAYPRIALVETGDWHCASEKRKSHWDKLENLLQGIVSKVDRIRFDEIPSSEEKYDLFIFYNHDQLQAFKCLCSTIKRNFFKFGKTTCPEELGGLVWDHLEQNLRDTMQQEIIQGLMDRGIYVVLFRVALQEGPYLDEIYAQEKKKAALGPAQKDREKLEWYLKEYFADLYSEEYVRAVLGQEYTHVRTGDLVKLKDETGKYYNVVDGERVTVGQPEHYQHTAYFFGRCFAAGWHTDDANTLPSLFQAECHTRHSQWRVVNCGTLSKDYYVYYRICHTKFRKGDMVILFDASCHLHGNHVIDLFPCFEREHIPVTWIWNTAIHVNHKVNAIWAKTLHDSIPEKAWGSEEAKDYHDRAIVPLTDLLHQYETRLYMARYFENYRPRGKVGAVVMNCNPFTNGHRYLVEKACALVDELLVFVVEEDKALFSFNERFSMVKKGCHDLANVRVIPSGKQILSLNTFPAYFVKEERADLENSAEKDISYFAKVIAPRLSISCRFAGEEPNDPVTMAYNDAMRRILPENGIEFIEIPRLLQAGKNEVISASFVREKLENGRYDDIRNLVPKTTLEVLGL